MFFHSYCTHPLYFSGTCAVRAKPTIFLFIRRHFSCIASAASAAVKLAAVPIRTGMIFVANLSLINASSESSITDSSAERTDVTRPKIVGTGAERGNDRPGQRAPGRRQIHVRSPIGRRRCRSGEGSLRLSGLVGASA